MKHLRVLLLSTSFFMLTGFFGGETDLVKNTPIDQTVSDLEKKYGKLRPSQCQPEQQAGCQAKLGAPCKCLEVQTALGVKSETLYFVTHNGKVVEYLDSIGVTPQAAERLLSPIEEFSGDVAPSKIHEGSSGRGIQAYFLIWNQKSVSFKAAVWCPLTKYGGKMQVTTKIRKCMNKILQASRVREFTATQKTVSADY
ncbi:MAG: hypothetical protein AB7O96_19015 [Pseudobdellovibrionaceae bacterium]